MNSIGRGILQLTTPRPWQSRACWCQACRWVVGLLLIVAATLKGQHFVASHPAGDAGLREAFFSGYSPVIVVVEIALGMSLLLNRAQRATWIATLALFLLFAVVSFGKLVRGDHECGCFGTFEVHPGWTLTLDLGVLIALGIFRPQSPLPLVKARAAQPQRHLLPIKSGFARAFVVACSVALATISASQAVMKGAAHEGSAYFQRSPNELIGRRLALLETVDIGEELSTGAWLVALVRPTCPKCLERIAAYETYARALRHQSDAPRFAIVELDSDDSKPVVSHNSRCVVGKQIEKFGVRFEVPVVLFLRDGIVMAVIDDEAWETGFD